MTYAKGNLLIALLVFYIIGLMAITADHLNPPTPSYATSPCTKWVQSAGLTLPCQAAYKDKATWMEAGQDV